jgi:hypothetical protein
MAMPAIAPGERVLERTSAVDKYKGYHLRARDKRTKRVQYEPVEVLEELGDVGAEESVLVWAVV